MRGVPLEDDDNGHVSVSLLVTDTFLFLCEEDVLETKGLRSRFVIKAVEPLTDLSHVVSRRTTER